MTASRAGLAALNNALWCDSVCRAHAAPGEFQPGIWLNRNIVPPYYPNLVVMTNAKDRGKMLAYVRELIELPIPGKWSVKDSFANFELESLGFELLFEATWIWRGATRREPEHTLADIHWRRVTRPAELFDWETAWEGNAHNHQTASNPAQFPAVMLADRRIAFFSGSLDHEIIAGGIANRSNGVVGLSNFFVNSGDVQGAWSGLVQHVQGVFPSLPIVGYERNRALKTALACGFEPTRNLRVWIRQG